MIAADVEDSIVMLNVELGSYFELNTVASAIWTLAEHPCTVAEIHASLLEQFDVEPEQCKRETMNFLNDMIARGILIQTSSNA